MKHVPRFQGISSCYADNDVSAPHKKHPKSRALSTFRQRMAPSMTNPDLLLPRHIEHSLLASLPHCTKRPSILRLPSMPLSMHQDRYFS